MITSLFSWLCQQICSQQQLFFVVLKHLELIGNQKVSELILCLEKKLFIFNAMVPFHCLISNMKGMLE